MKTIILIRHAQYKKAVSLGKNSKTLDEILELTDGGLTSIGIKQAQCVRDFLAPIKIDKFFSSDLVRSKESASIIISGHPDVKLKASSLLRECLPSMPQSPEEEISHLEDSDIENSKSIADGAYTRFIEQASSTTSTDVIVCHGNLIRYFVSRVIGSKLDGWTKMDVMNCGITKITLEAGVHRLETFNESGHLPDIFKTYS